MISSSVTLKSAIALCITFLLTVFLLLKLKNKFKNIFADNNVFPIIIMVVFFFEGIIATLLIRFFI